MNSTDVTGFARPWCGRAQAAVWTLLLLAAGAFTTTGCGKVKSPAADSGASPVDASGADAAPDDPCGPGGHPTYDQAWQCLDTTICTLFSRCQIPTLQEDCEQRAPYEFSLFDRDDLISEQIIRQQIAAGVTEFHPDNLADCIANIEGADCQQIETDLDFSTLCPIFTGTVADGDPCVLGTECATAGARCEGSALCQQNDVCCMRKCTPPVAVGGDCSGGERCASGGHCVNGACTAGEMSDPCNGDGDCDPGFWCDTAQNSCKPDVADGAPCSGDAQCPSPQTCLGNNLSGGTMGTCGRSDEVNDSCDGMCSGFACYQPDPAQLGTCLTVAAEGESCANVPCLGGLSCDGTRHCVRNGDVGASCATTADCRGALFCSTDVTPGNQGMCTAPQAASKACTSDNQCQSDICSGSAAAPGSCKAFPDCYP